MAMTLAQLQNQLSGLETYTPESEDVLRERAAAVYDPQYQQDVKSLAESLQLQLNQQERGAVRTGMQRSSYANSALAGLRGAGLKAQEQLAAQREGNIANLLLQLIQGEKDRKADADKQRDNLLLNLYQLSQPKYSYSSNGSGSGLGTTTPAANTPSALSGLSDGIQNIMGEFLTQKPNFTQPTTTKTNVPSSLKSTGGGRGKVSLMQEGRLAL